MTSGSEPSISAHHHHHQIRPVRSLLCWMEERLNLSLLPFLSTSAAQTLVSEALLACEAQLWAQLWAQRHFLFCLIGPVLQLQLHPDVLGRPSAAAAEA